MKTTQITASPRPAVGKRGSKDLRNAEKVPAVIYNEGKAEHISINYLDAKKVLHTPESYIVGLEIEGGQTVTALVREAQYHPVTDRILHIDFFQVNEERAVEVNLPLELTGTPIGVTKGGKLLPKLRHIKVRGIPAQLPEKISVDVSALDLGATIKVKDATFPGMTIVTSSTSAIASVEIPRSLRSAKTADAKK